MQKLIWPVLTAFMLCLLAGPALIRGLQKLKFGQVIKPDGPSWHAGKSGTPTMGGILIIAAALAATLAFARGADANLIVGLGVVLLFALVGFWDDWLSIKRGKNDGLSARQKLVCQTVIGLAAAVYAYVHIGSQVRIPFSAKMWDMGIWYIPMAAFWFVAFTNSSNLTDGLDGLASGVALVYFASMAVVFFSIDKMGLDDNTTVMCAAFAGACLGFLRFNAYPARLFMGDTGSLPLGAAVTWVALVAKMPLWMPVMLFMYLLSSISVIIQVAYYKRTKKRVFKMAPLHHHFEKLGYPEMKITAMYTIITAALCLLGMAAVVA